MHGKGGVFGHLLFAGVLFFCMFSRPCSMTTAAVVLADTSCFSYRQNCRLTLPAVEARGVEAIAGVGRIPDAGIGVDASTRTGLVGAAAAPGDGASGGENAPPPEAEGACASCVAPCHVREARFHAWVRREMSPLFPSQRRKPHWFALPSRSCKRILLFPPALTVWMSRPPRSGISECAG